MANILAATVCNIAQNEIGYLEKITNSLLDSKTANAGSDSNKNFTKYARDTGHANGNYWCETFIHWCFMKAYGRDTANSLLCGAFSSASTLYVKDAFASKGRLVNLSEALMGDIVWRDRTNDKGKVVGGHVGLVVGILNGKIVTIEGNTDPNVSTVNGGCVALHVNQPWKWCGRPAYDGAGSFKMGSGYNGGAVSDNDFDLGSTALSAISSVFGSIKQDAIELGTGLLNIFTTLGSLSFTVQNYVIKYETVESEIERDVLKTVDSNEVLLGGTNSLLTYPTLVEAPFVQVKIGDYTFGKYTGKGGSLAGQNVDFPNYVNGITVNKYSGQLNEYSISIVYLIQAGDDPNRLDRIFSTVLYGNIYISYGDYNAPTFIYKEEEAMITGVLSSVSFDSSLITYTVKAVSTALLAASNAQDFKAPEGKVKPSSVIRQILFNSAYGLQNVFTGMTNSSKITESIIPTDDQPVELQTKNGIDPLSYILYLVSCMSASSEGYSKGEDGVTIKKYTYKMVICDNTFDSNSMGGCYFKIVKVATNASQVNTSNVYNIDIGYTNYHGITKDSKTSVYMTSNALLDNKIISFDITSDDSWNLLYKYSEDVDQPKYKYSINSEGAVVAEYSPGILTSNSQYKMTESLKTWWTNMTLFPISATLVMKGLVRPAILMTYVKINALFYGLKHVSSGLYVITGLTDTINGQGYRTTLQLQKCGGDTDTIEKTKVKVKSTIPTGIEIVEKGTKSLSDLSFFGVISLLTSITLSDSENWADAVTGGMYSTVTNAVNGLTGGALTQETYSGQGGYTGGGDLRLAKIAAAMATEQGFGDDPDTLIALGWETSLLLNIYEKLQAKLPEGATIDDYIFAGDKNAENRKKAGITIAVPEERKFFATAAASAYLYCPGIGLKFTFYRGKSSTSGTVTQKMVDVVKEVLNGKRYTNANELGCDYGRLECNGVRIEGREKFREAKQNRPDLFIPGVTKLQVIWSDGREGAKSTFVGFPANKNKKFDAFAIK